MKNIAVAVFLFSLLIFSSCSKDGNTTEPTVAEKLKGRWTDVKITEDYLTNGEHYYDTTYAVPGDFTFFKADSVVFGDDQGPYLQIPYILLNNNQIIFNPILDPDTFDISKITANELVLHDEYYIDDDFVIEDWYYVK
jgi:hypothetical protein